MRTVLPYNLNSEHCLIESVMGKFKILGKCVSIIFLFGSIPVVVSIVVAIMMKIRYILYLCRLICNAINIQIIKRHIRLLKVIYLSYQNAKTHIRNTLHNIHIKASEIIFKSND